MTAALPNAADVRIWAQKFCAKPKPKPVFRPELYQWIPQPKWCEREAALLGVTTTQMRRRIRYEPIDDEFKWKKSLFIAWVREDYSVASDPRWKSWATEINNPLPRDQRTISRVRDLMRSEYGPHTNATISQALNVSISAAKSATRRLAKGNEIIHDPKQSEIGWAEFRRYIWNHNQKGNAE